MKSKIIIILVLIVSIDCIKNSDFCHNQNKQECDGGKFKFSCADILCAKNEKKCQSLTLLSNFSKFQKNKRDYNYEKKKFETFMRQIKDCSSSHKMRY